jgi:hypothetical protein
MTEEEKKFVKMLTKGAREIGDWVQVIKFGQEKLMKEQIFLWGLIVDRVEVEMDSIVPAGMGHPCLPEALNFVLQELGYHIIPNITDN